jgi:DNA primase
MIKQKTIQTIFETVKVEDIVSDFVKLTRRGVNYIGRCPFHNEKTPSFTVSPAKNIYKCFGCGAGGNPINFIMEHEQLSYPEALRYAAQKYGIEIEENELTPEEKAEIKLADSLYLVNQFAKEYFQKQLFETDYGKSVGLSYFKKRGFREEIIQKFGLGFANGGANDMLQSARGQGYDTETLNKAGLTKNDRDFFRNRVMFPIHNVSGKTIGFGGRILTQNKKAPKYLNTPESDIYNKRKSLYGVYFARKAMVKQDECYMVEGYTDVISLHQAGIENIVASSGTSLTVEQIQLVKRYTPNMTILYDGDAAGIKAALRGLDLVIAQDMNVKVVQLPQGEDPDSYLQQLGATAFKEYIKEEAHDFILFKTNLLLEETSGDPIKKAGLIKDIVQSIAKVPDAIKRSLYVKSCAARMEMSEQLLLQELNKQLKKQIQEFEKQKRYDNNRNSTKNYTNNQPSPPPPSEYGQDIPFDPYDGMPMEDSDLPPPNDGMTAEDFAQQATSQTQSTRTNKEYQEIDITRILVNFGDRPIDEESSVAEFLFLDMEMIDFLSEFNDPICTKIVTEYLERLKANKETPTSFFTAHADPTISKFAVDLVATLAEHSYSDGWEKMNVYLNSQKMPELNHVADAKSGILRFKLKKVEKLIDKNQSELKAAQSNKESYEDIIILLKVHQQLVALRTELAEQLHTVVLR